MAIYGSEILSNDVQNFIDDVATEVLLPDSDLLGGSFPEFNEDSANSADNIYDMTGSQVIPSEIPSAIDRLWAYNNKKPEIGMEIGPILKLKETLISDYILENYNGLCINLDATKYVLKIGRGSTLVAL